MSSEEEKNFLEDCLHQAILKESSKKPLDCIEIRNIPSKMKREALNSLFHANTKICPIKSEICQRSDYDGDTETVGLVMFKTAPEAHSAVERIRAKPFSRSWEMKFIPTPEVKTGHE